MPMMSGVEMVAEMAKSDFLAGSGDNVSFGREVSDWGSAK